MDGERYVVNPKGEWLDLNIIPPIDKIFFEPTGETCYMITSRGCPFNCSYCASPLLCGRVVRFESMNRVVAQMKMAYDDGKRFFHFLDDQFLISEKRAREFFEGLKNVGLYGRITWRAMTRVDVLLRMSEETLYALKESGGTTIAIGIESGCNRILKMTHKGSDNSMAKVMVKKLVNLGFIVKAFFILGFPTETYREIQETRNFIMELGKLGLSYFNVAILRPYPGTEVYYQLLGQGYRPEEIFYEDIRDNIVAPDKKYIHGYYNYLNRQVQISAVSNDELRRFISDMIQEFDDCFGRVD